MLTNENYFAPESSQSYMSVSQFKSFLDCEARTMAELNGEYHKATTDSLLIGSYVDAFFEGTLQSFISAHPEMQIISSSGYSVIKNSCSIWAVKSRKFSPEKFAACRSNPKLIAITMVS